ncbi:hypothetical protein [Aliamphritea spongicola]|nr:hypothetical protein [Aliamphritea spongicola]
MTALRQAAFLTLVFLAVLMIAGWFSAQWISRELDSGINDELKLRHEALSRQLKDQPSPGSLLPNSSVMFASFTDARQQVFGADSKKLYRRAGLSEIEFEDTHSDEESRWRIYNAPPPVVSWWWRLTWITATTY